MRTVNVFLFNLLNWARAALLLNKTWQVRCILLRRFQLKSVARRPIRLVAENRLAKSNGFREYSAEQSKRASVLSEAGFATCSAAPWSRGVRWHSSIRARTCGNKARCIAARVWGLRRAFSNGGGGCWCSRERTAAGAWYRGRREL